MAETKPLIIRDPVNGFIRLNDYDFIKLIVESEHFQRLRRISQLGLSMLVYPSATHNRFSHSIGAMQVFWRIFDNLIPSMTISKGEIKDLRKLGTAAILLHDIGHGPFSHASEKVFNFHHEDMSKEIISRSIIADYLRKDGLTPKEITRVISRTAKNKNKLITQLVTSQLDADRLDYLQRDAYFTGVGFCNIDIDRIVNVLVVHQKMDKLNGQAVSLYKGYHSLESFIVTRYLMYQGVYLHKTTRCFEILTRKAIERFVTSSQSETPTELQCLLEGRSPTLKELLELDDYFLYSQLKKWTKSTDPILSELCSRVINRQSLSSIEISQKPVLALAIDRKIRRLIEKSKKDPDYFLFEDDATDTPYKPYKPISMDDEKSPITNIFALDEEDNPKEISDLSAVVHSISQKQYSSRYYFPKELKEEVNMILKRGR